MLQPLLPCGRHSRRGPSACTPVQPLHRDLLCDRPHQRSPLFSLHRSFSTIFRSLYRKVSEQLGAAMVKSVGWSGASADATSPGMARTVGPFSRTACGIERSRLEKLVRVQLLERRCVNNARLYIPGDGDNRRSFFPCVHQSVGQLDDSGPRGSTHHHWVTCEISLRDRREYSILLITQD